MGKHIKKTIKRKTIKRKNNRKQTNQKVTEQNTLRNMLLMKSGFIPSGYAPQQYGNVNDKINSLQLTESNLHTQNLMQKKQLEELHKNIDELKQAKHDINKKHYRAENEYDKLRIQLDELEREKGKTDVIQLQIANLSKQIGNITLENVIKELILEKNKVQQEYDKKAYESKLLTEQINQNKLKEEIERTKQETAIIVAKNQTMHEYVNSKEFLEPHKVLVDYYHQKLIAEDMYKLLSEQHDMEIANAEIDSKINAFVKDDQKTKQAIQEQAKHLAEERSKNRKQTMKLSLLDNYMKKEEELEKETNNLSIDNKVDNAEIEQLKESNDGSIDTAYTELGKTKAKKIKSNRVLKNRMNIANMKDEITTNTAEANEFNSHKTIKESVTNRKLGETKAKLKETEQLLNATEQAVESNRLKEVAKGGTDYYNSMEFNKTDEEIARLKTEKEINDKQRKEIELANKAEEQASKSLHQLAALQNSRGVDMQNTYNEEAIANQVSYFAETAEQEEKDRVNKQSMIDKISQLAQQRENQSNCWKNFITDEKYSKHANFMKTPYAFDIQTMNEIYNDFLHYTHKSKFNMPIGFNNDIVVEEEEEE